MRVNAVSHDKWEPASTRVKMELAVYSEKSFNFASLSFRCLNQGDGVASAWDAIDAMHAVKNAS